MNSAQMLSQLAPLVKWDKSDLTAEALKSFEALPEGILKSIYDAKVGEIREWEQTAKLVEERKRVYPKWVEELEEDMEEDEFRQLEKLAGDEMCHKIAKTGHLKISAKLGRVLLKALADKREVLELEFDNQHKPKPAVKKTGGKRSKFEGTTECSNTPETPDDAGTDHKYYFKGDEKAVWKKTTSVSNGVKKEKYKAVRSRRYLGGADSKPDDGKCCGVCVWDKASGSNAIKDTGLSPSQFKVRCDEDAGEDGYCRKCRKNPINFFEGTYNISRGSGKKFSGKTYKQFICEELEYV